MDYIYKEQALNISIDVFKGQSAVKEDFSRADLKVFLVRGVEKVRIPLNINIDSQGTLKGSISHLPEGVYGIKAVWFKNGGRSPMYAERYQMFCVTEYSNEATNPDSDTVLMMIRLHTATYGYDGLDAYELSVLRGKTNLSEDAWLDMINNAGGGSAVVKPVGRTEGKWMFVTNLDKTVADAEGETINYAASLSRTNSIIYSDGHTEPETETGTVTVTTNNAEAASVKDGYIEFKPNMAASERTIVVTFTPSAEGEASKSISVKQSPAAQIVLKSGKDAADRNVLDLKTNTIVCYDEGIIIDFEKRGNVGGVTAEFLDGFSLWDVEVSGNKIAIDVSPNNTSSVVEAKLRINFGNGKSIDIEIYQTYIKSTTYSDATAKLTYADISADGTSRAVTPVIRYDQNSIETRSNGFVITKEATYKSVTFSATESLEGFSITPQGQVTYSVKNVTTSKVKVASVKATITTADGSTIEAPTDIYQSGAVLKMMIGVLKSSVSQFETLTDALASSITSDMIETSIRNGSINTCDVRDKDNPVSLSATKKDYVVGLIPKDAAFNAYKWQQHDGLGAYVDFYYNNPDHHTAGDKEIVVNGTTYYLYCMYVANTTYTKKFINYVEI